MKKNLALLAVLFSLGAAGPVLADDDHGHGKGLFIDRDVDTFAVLPEGVTNPEGITANPANGDIYVSTFVAPFKLLRCSAWNSGTTRSTSRTSAISLERLPRSSESTRT